MRLDWLTKCTLSIKDERLWFKRTLWGMNGKISMVKTKAWEVILCEGEFGVFHSRRHASKPLLTHMLEAQTEESENLICFRSASRPAQEKRSTLSGYSFLCFLRSLWWYQAKLKPTVWAAVLPTYKFVWRHFGFRPETSANWCWWKSDFTLMKCPVSPICEKYASYIC